MNNMRGQYRPYQRYDMPHPTGCMCGTDRGQFPESTALAMAYVPLQTNTEMYDKCKALDQGTVFPVLDKPFMKSGCCR